MINSQNLREIFLHKWVSKKNRLPFSTGNRKPAFFCRKISDNFDNTISMGNGTRFKKGKRAPNPINFLEIISEEEANSLNLLWFTAKNSSITLSEKTDSHFREDNGAEKVGYSLDNYQIPLYRLMIMYPQKKVSAYKCKVCNQIHIGKE